MNRKEINELRRALRPGENIIQEIYTCYVTADKEMVSFERVPIFDISEEEEEEYFKLFKKVLSTDIDRKFLNLDFPNHQNDVKLKMHKIVKNNLEKTTVEEIFDNIIDYYDNEAAYAILMAKGVYDIPTRSTDGYELEGSNKTFNFIITAICPIKLSKPTLVFSNSANKFVNASTDWVVTLPEIGFLYPSFTGREANANELGYYMKNLQKPHEKFLENLLHCKIPMTFDDQKVAFADVVEKSFDGNVPVKAVISINESAQIYCHDKEEESENGPMAIFEIEDMLKAAGAKNINIEGDIDIMAENVAEKKYTFESEGIKLIVDQSAVNYIHQEEVNGTRSLVIPIYDMTLNGIKISK